MYLSKFKIINILVILLLVVTLSLLIINSTSKKLPNIVEIHGSVTEKYEGIDALYDDSLVIARVEINNNKTIIFNRVPFTISDAEILELYKGTTDINKISILETGGTVDRKNYVFEGNSVFRINDSAIVFLKKYEGPIAENAYVISGVYQGKFLTDNSNRVQVPEGLHGDFEKVKFISDLNL